MDLDVLWLLSFRIVWFRATRLTNSFTSFPSHNHQAGWFVSSPVREVSHLSFSIFIGYLLVFARITEECSIHRVCCARIVSYRTLLVCVCADVLRALERIVRWQFACKLSIWFELFWSDSVICYPITLWRNYSNLAIFILPIYCTVAIAFLVRGRPRSSIQRFFLRLKAMSSLHSR